MPEATAVRRERSLMELTDILRRVAGAVRGLKDFDQFVGGAARLYQGVSTLAGRKIGFDPVVDGKALPLPISQTPAINAPISSGDALAGFVRVYPSEETRQFGPEDLHIAGALADLTAALVDVSIQLRGGDGLEQMMRQITDQLPLGLVCFLPSGELVIANAQSRVMLGGFVWKTFSDAWEFLRERSESGEIPEGPGRFSVSLPSGTVHVEIKEVETGGVPTCTVVTMAQFTANERQLVQALERESYRSRWLKQPLSFLAIRAVGDPTDLFASIPGPANRSIRWTSVSTLGVGKSVSCCREGTGCRRSRSRATYAGAYPKTRCGLVVPRWAVCQTTSTQSSRKPLPTWKRWTNC